MTLKATIVLLLITLTPEGNIEGVIVKEYKNLVECKMGMKPFMVILNKQQASTNVRLMATCVGYMKKVVKPGTPA